MLPSGPHFLRTRRRRFGFEVHPAKPTTKQWLALLPKQRLWFSRYSSGAGTAEPRIFFLFKADQGKFLCRAEGHAAEGWLKVGSFPTGVERLLFAGLQTATGYRKAKNACFKLFRTKRDPPHPSSSSKAAAGIDDSNLLRLWQAQKQIFLT